MATVREIYNFIDSIAPFNTAEEWDNSGLLVGDENKTVNKIMFALDCTNDVIEQALSCDADLIVTHHPVIFKPLSEISADCLVYKLIKNDLSIICAHTNYDKAIEGVNDILCYSVELEKFAEKNKGKLTTDPKKESVFVFEKIERETIKKEPMGILELKRKINTMKNSLCSL